MKISTVLRHFREGLKNVVRNGWMTFASVSSIVISLFILGVFLLLAMNVNVLAGQIESQVQIRVYLQLDTPEAKIGELKNAIGNMPEVKKVTFVSKEQGLEDLRKSIGADGTDLLEGYDETNNPLPDSFTVDVFDPQNIAYAAKKIDALGNADAAKPFTSVKYGKGTVEKLFRITNAVRNIGLVIVAGLALTAMFLISNTIKTTILARRREIGIMKLVGATNNFIRWPFFIEGALIGFIGAAVTVAGLLLGYSQLVDASQFELGLMMIKLVTLKEAGLTVSAVIFGLGMLIGIWGSTLSVRKYLKV
ncbi:permease-like cell division protein FtsX [Paenibacillus sp. MWE-103]|uniref:Cell division protein FtsX n=1 Tax=Paenibacillus artemisiicola TaxID=1172618 RepID=A0ABS3WG05_9BACL|nr:MULTISPECIES: permease-like cell division protein FtsX [Paenibacillus]MBO7747261.1 permease-like cell division protein FtsX [Paenibacillus artemisiicola]SFJ27231.1 cell division transport system permease protein [Paenibacillus sp. UNC496MF]